MPQVYTCVPTCGKEFLKSSSLAQHKQSCRAALEMRKKSQLIRKDKGDDAFPKETSPFGRKQRLQVGVVSLPVRYESYDAFTICVGFNPGGRSSGTYSIIHVIYWTSGCWSTPTISTGTPKTTSISSSTSDSIWAALSSTQASKEVHR